MQPRVIFGLGNPGGKYESTRHNAGFRAIDVLAGFESFKSEGKALVAKKNLGGRNLFLVKPQTFMNLSGECVQGFLAKNRIKPDEILVLVDDIQLDEGRLRIRMEGSHGGQNGLRDIINRIGPKFPRVRIGVGKVPTGFDVSRWVLSVPKSEEQEKIRRAEEVMSEVVECICTAGYTSAMAKFNGFLP